MVSGQLVSLGNPGQQAFALLKLDDEGRLWYGALKYDGTRDSGPTKVVWRLVDDEHL